MPARPASRIALMPSTPVLSSAPPPAGGLPRRSSACAAVCGSSVLRTLSGRDLKYSVPCPPSVVNIGPQMNNSAPSRSPELKTSARTFSIAGPADRPRSSRRSRRCTDTLPARAACVLSGSRVVRRIRETARSRPRCTCTSIRPGSSVLPEPSTASAFSVLGVGGRAVIDLGRSCRSSPARRLARSPCRCPRRCGRSRIRNVRLRRCSRDQHLGLGRCSPCCGPGRCPSITKRRQHGQIPTACESPGSFSSFSHRNSFS